MKLLTKNTDYAIRALIELAQKDSEYISSREISKKQDIPYEYLRKILQALISNKYAVSKEGGKGGVKINSKPEKIKVIDIINLFQGEVQFSECVFRKQICQNKPSCVLRKNIKRIEDIVKKEFEGITIGSLLQEQGER